MIKKIISVAMLMLTICLLFTGCVKSKYKLLTNSNKYGVVSEVSSCNWGLTEFIKMKDIIEIRKTTEPGIIKIITKKDVYYDDLQLADYYIENKWSYLTDEDCAEIFFDHNDVSFVMNY